MLSILQKEFIRLIPTRTRYKINPFFFSLRKSHKMDVIEKFKRQNTETKIAPVAETWENHRVWQTALLKQFREIFFLLRCG